MKPYSLPGRQGGLTLIELIVGRVIIAVALTALMATIPILSGSSSARDADVLAREGRNCAELLLALHTTGDLNLSVDTTPSAWASGDASTALEELCGDGDNRLTSVEATNEDSDIFKITISRGNISPLELFLEN